MNKKCGKEKLNNKGAAMMLTIIIIAVVMIFVFSLIIISYNLYASQAKNMSGIRNAEAVNSMSIATEKELTDSNAIQNSNFWKYLRMNVAYQNETADPEWQDWPYYDANDQTGNHDAESAFRYFKLEKNDTMEGVPAEMNMCVYWTIPSKEEASPTAQEITDFKDALDSGDLYARNKIRLHVITVANTGSQTYEVEDIYELLITEADSSEKIALKSARKNNAINPARKEINLEEKWIWVHKEKR